MNRPEVIIAQLMNKVDATTGELTDENTRTHIAGQLKAFAAFARRG
jgi:hypothetical protein